MWFKRYGDRKFFVKMGYTSRYEDLMDDEAEWFRAIERKVSELEELYRSHGK